jgi:hypothetical protein
VKPSTFRLELIVCGFGGERFYQLKVCRLKTQADHELRRNHVVLPFGLFAGCRGQAGERAPAVPALHRQSGAAWFRPADRYLSARLPHGLDHAQNGNQLLCECGRTAHERMRAEATERVAE